MLWHMARILMQLSGRKFGRLLVLEEAPIRPPYYRYWRCRCDCGATVEVGQRHLRAGTIVSCGCWKNENTARRSRTHGASKSPEFRVWAKMRQRCENPSDPKYPSYGARGIQVCRRWQNFALFLADMGQRPSPQHSLERRNNDGHYEPGNVRWATAQEQANNRRSSKVLTFQGRTQTLAQWSRETGLNYGTIQTRLKGTWSVDEALTISPRPLRS